MKVFLSWSGHKSHQVALAFRDWLPSVIQSITPYVSSEDIDKGARWSTDIAKELEDSSFGILCVTKDNLEAPWLHFEAGALSKMMDKASVCPFIFDLKRVDVNGPILQFQSTIFEKEDVKKLLFTLNKACGESGLKEELLSKTFEVWWPNLKESLEAISGETSEEEEKKIRHDSNFQSKILEEVLELSRTNQKLLRSPEALFPPEYVKFIIRNIQDANKETYGRERALLEEQQHIALELKHLLIQMRSTTELYMAENKTRDEEYYMNIRRILDTLQHQQMLSEQMYKFYRNK